MIISSEEEEEEIWAGARELVDSSYQPTYVVLEGHNPIPSALSCTFLPANRQATSIFIKLSSLEEEEEGVSVI